MNKFTPWKIENGTLQLLPWPDHPPGEVLVDVDVFDELYPRMRVLSEKTIPEDDISDDPWHPVKWWRGDRLIDAGETLVNGWGKERPATVADCLQALFAHIDAHPETTYTLRTLHPERVRECWPRTAVHQCSECGSRHVGIRLPDGFKCAECEAVVSTKYRPNVTLSLGPLATQADADRLVDLCGTDKLNAPATPGEGN